MRWNWQQNDWPNFCFDAASLALLEARFLRQGGVVIGSVQHLGEDDRDVLTVEIISAEALKTSEIEGEILDRESLQSSIRRQFGLVTDHRRVGPAEQGIAAQVGITALRYRAMTSLPRDDYEPARQESCGAGGRMLKPCGFADCQRHASAHMASSGRRASHPSSLRAREASA